MDLKTVLISCGACAAVAVFAGWRGARPPDFKNGPRLIPWRFIMFTAAVAAIVLLGMAEQISGIHPLR